MRRLPLLILSAIILFFPGASHPESRSDPPETAAWTKVRKLYDQGRFEEALAALQHQNEETRGATYHYNLGNIYYRLKNYGKAIAHFERALELSPLDSDIRYNLELARQEFKTYYGSAELDPASTWLEQVSDSIPQHWITALFGFVLLLFSLTILRNYRKTQKISVLFKQPSLMFAAALLIFTGAVYSSKLHFNTDPAAVCMKPVVIRSGPGNHFLEMKRIPAGTKIRLTGSRMQGPANPETGRNELWFQIRYARGSAIGWIPASSVLLLGKA